MSTKYDFSKALKKPTKVYDLCVFLSDLESFSELDQLDQFTELKELSLLDGKGLSAFPLSILKLKNLESLRFRNTNIKTLPDEISNLKKLKTFKYEIGPLFELPPTFGELEFLEELDLIETELTNLPELTKLIRLKEVFIRESQLKNLPASIGNLKNLKRFYCTVSSLTQIPDEIGLLNKLESLHLNHNKIKKLPGSISRLSQLGNLNLEHNSFKTFPTQICELNLNVLSLNHNQITQLPEALSNFKDISRLSLDHNDFTSFPSVLLDWKTNFGQNARWMFSIDSKLHNQKKISKILDKKSFHVLERKDKQIHFDIFIQNQNALDQIENKKFLSLLNSKITEVADIVLEQLTKDSFNTLSQNIKVYNNIKGLKNKNQLKEALSNIGIELTESKSDDFQHILVKSRGNKSLDNFDKERFNWVTETQLRKFIDKIEPSYLVEESAIDNQESIKSLILSLDENNFALALEIIKGGGLPDQLISYVFIVYKLSDNPPIRKLAGQLLREKASIDLLKVIRRRTVVRCGSQYMSNSEMNELCCKIDDYGIDNAIDKGLLAYAISKKYSLNYGYALNYNIGDFQFDILKNCIKNNVFNLGYYEQRLKSFPMELLKFTKLRKIDISVYGGEWNGESFETNDQFVLPENITLLSSLESIILYGPVINLRSELLAQLKNLKELRINKSPEFDLEIFKKANPDCRVSIYGG
jgi:Leucine-rich repeat (LRR) protein